MDRLSPAQRSYVMSCVRTKDNDLERLVRLGLHRNGCRFRTNMKSLPGSPTLFLYETGSPFSSTATFGMVIACRCGKELCSHFGERRFAETDKGTLAIFAS